MGILVDWFAPQSNILCMTVTGSWTWDEFHIAMSTAYELMDKAAYDHVDYLLDLRQGQTLPSNILSRMKNRSQSQHPKSRNMVVVGAGSFPATMFSIMEKIVPQRMAHITLVATLEEALQHLQDQPARL